MSIFRGLHGPLLIAEIGGNHEGDFDSALRLTDMAIDAGVDAVKFQIYYGDTLVSAVESPARNAHFRRFELAPTQHRALADRVLNAGRACIASVWDIEAFEWAAPLMSACKIGSGDLTAPPFLRAAATTDKPLILSTGLSDMTEVGWAVEFIRSTNPLYSDRSQLAVLQCTSMYPITAGDANLAVMKAFSAMNVTPGYSDHTVGWRALEIAAAMGAEVLEFHFTDQKHGRAFRDHQLSLDGADVVNLIDALDEIRTLRGASVKEPLEIEVANDHVRSFRRAVYPAYDVAAGAILDDSNLCVLRPNHGIDAREYYGVIGRRTRRNLARHERLDWSDIE